MLTSEEFVERWRLLRENAEFVRYEPVMFEGLDIPQESVAFLLEAGLPESAAPLINMERARSITIPTVADELRIPEIPRCFRWLGSDGEGSPICIQEGSGSIVLLDHDCQFKVIFMNTTVSQFAVFLLTYGEIATQAARENDCDVIDVLVEPTLAVERKHELAEKLRQIDAAALEPECFWWRELVSIGAIHNVW